ncbi:MAG TPA: hypothetical protein VMZ29_08680 [Candidatus Bathyarchaeia archaeon]|nr:hypothetical protein [Candidatus Bathyarchaeia archaeon]
MNGFMLLKIFYKRNFKTVLTSALVFLTVLGLIGITLVSTAIPYTSALSEELAKIDTDSCTTIGYESMSDIEFPSINQTLSTIDIDEARIEYGMLLCLNATINNQTLQLPIFGFTDSLYDYLGYPTRKIISSQDFAYSVITLSLPNETNPANYSLFINDFQNFSYDDNYDILTRILHSSYMTPPLYNAFDQFLCANLSLLNNIIDTFPRDSLAISAFIMVHYDDAYLERLSINKLEKVLNENEISIFKSCLKGGFSSEFIRRIEYLKGAITLIKADIGYEVSTIQLLSVPNIIIVIIIIFSLDLGMYTLLKQKGKFLWTRGLSLKRTLFILIFSEIASDFFMVIIAQLIFSIVILACNLPYSLLLSLFTINMLMFAIVSISKFARFLFKHKQILSDDKSEIFTKEQKEHQVKRRKVSIYTGIILTILLLALALQLFAILEPLFWFPVFNGSLGLAVDIISVIAIAGALLGYSFLSSNAKKKNEKLFSFENLYQKLFKSKLSKKITQQRIITFGLCIIVTYLTFVKIGNINYDTSYLESTDISWDVKLSNGSSGFNYSKVSNLQKNILEIDLTFPYTGCGISFTAKDELFISELDFFNSSLLSSYVTSWNYFVGHVRNNHTNEDVSDLSTKTIILNQNIAERSGLREGDVISINVLLPGLPGFDGSEIYYPVENVTIIGIVDTLPIGSGFKSASMNYAFADLSFIANIYNNLGVDFMVDGLVLDLNLDPSLHSFVREDKIMEIANEVQMFFEIEDNLNVVFIDNTGKYLFQDTKAETYFIVYDAILIVLLLPILIIVFNFSFLKDIAPSMNKIISRGYSAKRIVDDTNKTLLINYSKNILFGLIAGLTISLIYLKYEFPSLLFASNLLLFMQLGLLLLGLIVANIVALVITRYFTIKQFTNLIIEKRGI